jgi:hypothetical protein
MGAFAVTAVMLEGKDGATPLGGEGRGNILVRDNTETDKPMAQAFGSFGPLDLQRGLQLAFVDRATAEKHETERDAMLAGQRLIVVLDELGKDGCDAMLETIEAAIPTALEEDTFVVAALQEFPQRGFERAILVFTLQMIPPVKTFERSGERGTRRRIQLFRALRPPRIPGAGAAVRRP